MLLNILHVRLTDRVGMSGSDIESMRTSFAKSSLCSLDARLSIRKGHQRDDLGDICRTLLELASECSHARYLLMNTMDVASVCG